MPSLLFDEGQQKRKITRLVKKKRLNLEFSIQYFLCEIMWRVAHLLLTYNVTKGDIVRKPEFLACTNQFTIAGMESC